MEMSLGHLLDFFEGLVSATGRKFLCILSASCGWNVQEEQNLRAVNCRKSMTMEGKEPRPGLKLQSCLALH